MWIRFAETLRCVLCHGSLELTPIDERTADLSREHLQQGERMGLSAGDLAAAVDSGLLVCPRCRIWFPVLHGLPILLPYSTPLREEFTSRHPGAVERLGEGYRCPAESPTVGEEFVLKSFSREWLDYSYDGVLWIWSYEDREAIFVAEMGREPVPSGSSRFLEVGCGLGLVTSFAARHFPGDAVGVDLSLAALRAATQFRDHPFLHFAQASLFRLPLQEASFDLVYSHGVLHHTWSTEAAFRSIAAHCKPGGRTYIWVYGPGTNRENLFRRAAWGVELVVRPILSRLPAGLAKVALAPIAVGYMGINWAQRMVGAPRKPYNFQRALHIARDRLTPLYAHRHESDVVAGWFRDQGFEKLHLVSEKEVPEAAWDLMRRNVGMRGSLATPAATGPDSPAGAGGPGTPSA